jgi:hypothetical protein
LTSIPRSWRRSLTCGSESRNGHTYDGKPDDHAADAEVAKATALGHADKVSEAPAPLKPSSSDRARAGAG